MITKKVVIYCGWPEETARLSSAGDKWEGGHQESLANEAISQLSREAKH